MDAVKLLWTGGWDSTFRLLQLLFDENRRVETIYVLDERASLMEELEAMRAIRAACMERLGDDSLFPATTIHDSGQFLMDPKIEAVWNDARARLGVAKQYKYLANIAQQLGWSRHETEMCLVSIEAEDILKAEIFKSVPSSAGGPVELSDSPLAKLFVYWSFPVAALTKVDMVEMAESSGYGDILSMSWFCASPLRGEACGHCRPCGLAKKSGRRHRFSRWGTARKDYRRIRTAAAKRWRRLVGSDNVRGDGGS